MNECGCERCGWYACNNGNEDQTTPTQGGSE